MPTANPDAFQQGEKRWEKKDVCVCVSLSKEAEREKKRTKWVEYSNRSHATALPKSHTHIQNTCTQTHVRTHESTHTIIQKYKHAVV